MSFGTKEFWDLWYNNLKESNGGNVKPIEWYIDHQLLKNLLQTFIDKKSKILAIGCGNSTLSEQMYEDGFTNILNIDYSETVIKMMLSLPHKEGLDYKVMDVTDMKELSSNSFDVVLDKGTMDSMLCTDNWGIMFPKMFSEIQRVLKEGGKFICITEGSPQERMNYFSSVFGKDTKTETHTIEKESKHEFSPHTKYFVYIVQKPK